MLAFTGRISPLGFSGRTRELVGDFLLGARLQGKDVGLKARLRRRLRLSAQLHVRFTDSGPEVLYLTPAAL